MQDPSLLRLRTITPPYCGAAYSAYTDNPSVYACVRMIADAVADVPYKIVGADAALVAALLERPAPELAGRHLRNTLVSFLQLTGNAYALCLTDTGDADGRVREIRPLRSERIRVQVDPFGTVQCYNYAADGGVQALDPAMVLHIKLFSPASDLFGTAPLQAAASAIGVHRSTAIFQQSLLDNAARPSGCLSYESRNGAAPLSAEQYARLKQDIADLYSGTANAGRPLLLEGGLSWKSMSFSPNELQFSEVRRDAARDIAAAFGVPPMLLGIPGDNTYSNYQEALRAFTRNTVVPGAQMLFEALTFHLQATFPGLQLSVDVDRLPGYLPEREALWARVSAATFLTDAEKRNILGFI